jgi:hypothetical protein
MKVHIKQNMIKNYSKNSQNSMLDVVDESGEKIGRVLGMNNVCLSIGNFSITIELNENKKRKENAK